MCGIAGVIDFRGRPLDPEKVLAMGRVQRHRGPDGEGAVFFSDTAEAGAYRSLDDPDAAKPRGDRWGALVHLRLAIIDLSERAAQPMSDPSGRCWLTYNGEIYNYVELRRELEGIGHRFRSDSDTEVILHAYERWGLSFLERLNGMFAIALWDGRRRRLICARDRLGIKPLHYATHDGRILFASECKGILEALDRRPRPNREAMADYLCLSYVASDETMFEGIRRLPPGCLLVADDSGIDVSPYWAPVFAREDGRTDDDLHEELHALLRDSLRMQVRSDVPVGAHLSGGIDSSLICSLAAPQVDCLNTFSARFSGGSAFDESPFARRVAEKIGSRHHELTPRGGDLVEVLPRLLRALDEPIEGPAVFGKYHVAESVSRSVKVVLTGHGGDELFGGYDWYVKNLFTAACFGNTAALGEHGAAEFMVSAVAEAEVPRRLVRSLWVNRFDSDLGRIFFRNWCRIGPRAAARLFRTEAVPDPLAVERRFRQAYDALEETREGDRMFRFDMRHYLAALLASEDRLSMAFSVEARVPLLDHRVAELAGRLGFTRKTRPGRSKEQLRRVAKDVVPAEIVSRKDKQGFPTPVARWLADPSLGVLDRMVLNDNPFARRYFDLQAVRELQGRRFRVGSAWSETLWRVLCLSVWGAEFGLEG